MTMAPAMTVWGQSGSGIVFGTITEASGAVVAGAEVTAINTATGIKQVVKSDDTGNYIFSSLAAAAYRITCSATGFRTLERSGISLQVDQRAHVDFSLEVGQVQQVVVVLENITNLDTFSSTVKEVVDPTRMTQLPLNGRNALSLQGLLPGAVQMGTGSAASGVALNTNLVFSVNGAPPQSIGLHIGQCAEYGHVQQYSGRVSESGYAAGVFHPSERIQRRVRPQLRRRHQHDHKVGNEQHSRHGVRLYKKQLLGFQRLFCHRCASSSAQSVWVARLEVRLRFAFYNGRDRTFFFVGFELVRQTLGSTSSSTIVPTALERAGRFFSDDHRR